jgi:acyl-CoA thioester hydrolase
MHRFPIRVYYEDTDAGGVVYYANYLRYLERARTEALRDLGAAHARLQAEHGLIFMVRRVNLDYVSPARLDDSLIVETSLRRERGATVDLHQRVLRPEGALDVLLVDAVVQLACVQESGGRPGRIPPEWRAALANLAAPSDGV